MKDNRKNKNIKLQSERIYTCLICLVWTEVFKKVLYIFKNIYIYNVL